MSTFSVGWAFSLAIFFLGMSAAFAGRMVERDIHRSSLLSCICFTAGMIGTGVCIQFASGVAALVGIFICYGCIMGIGLGIGYLTPVKTLMLWFEGQKGLATGISIMGFGLAKAIATPIMELIQSRLGIAQMFYILGGVYFVMMMLGHFLLKKPEGWVEPQDSRDSFRPLEMFRDKTFLGIWLMFFLNIHCGLALITYEKQILSTAFAGGAALAAVISVVPSVTAAFNALGRIGFSTLSDRMRGRNTVYKIIFISCIAVTALGSATFAISRGSHLRPLRGDCGGPAHRRQRGLRRRLFHPARPALLPVRHGAHQQNPRPGPVRLGLCRADRQQHVRADPLPLRAHLRLCADRHIGSLRRGPGDLPDHGQRQKVRKTGGLTPAAPQMGWLQKVLLSF